VTSDSLQAPPVADTITPTPTKLFELFHIRKSTLSIYDETEADKLYVHDHIPSTETSLLERASLIFSSSAYVSKYRQYFPTSILSATEEELKTRMHKTWEFLIFSFVLCIYSYVTLRSSSYKTISRYIYAFTASSQSLMSLNLREVSKSKVLSKNINASATWNVNSLIPTAQLDIEKVHVAQERNSHAHKVFWFSRNILFLWL
jgi:hypothetical protein